VFAKFAMLLLCLAAGCWNLYLEGTVLYHCYWMLV
jgi:hypothetical protein